MIKSLSANKAHTSCGHIFRHTASIFLVGRQPACESSPCLAKNLSRNPHTPYSRIGSKLIDLTLNLESANRDKFRTVFPEYFTEG